MAASLKQEVETRAKAQQEQARAELQPLGLWTRSATGTTCFCRRPSRWASWSCSPTPGQACSLSQWRARGLLSWASTPRSRRALISSSAWSSPPRTSSSEARSPGDREGAHTRVAEPPLQTPAGDDRRGHSRRARTSHARKDRAEPAGAHELPAVRLASRKQVELHCRVRFKHRRQVNSRLGTAAAPPMQAIWTHGRSRGRH